MNPSSSRSDEGSRPCRLRAAEAARRLSAKLAELGPRLLGWAVILDSRFENSDEALRVSKLLWFGVQGDGLYVAARSTSYFADYFLFGPQDTAGEAEAKLCVPVFDSTYARTALPEADMVDENPAFRGRQDSRRHRRPSASAKPRRMRSPSSARAGVPLFASKPPSTSSTERPPRDSSVSAPLGRRRGSLRPHRERLRRPGLSEARSGRAGSPAVGIRAGASRRAGAHARFSHTFPLSPRLFARGSACASASASPRPSAST